MAICRYYQRGTCKFGSNCRYEHTQGGRTTYGGGVTGGATGNYYNNQYSYTPTNQQQQYSSLADNKTDYRCPKPAVLNPVVSFEDFVVSVCEEVRAAEVGKQWPLTCYSPRKESDNYPGLDDVSPEELRHEAYQCQLTGTSDTYLWNVNQMYKAQSDVCQKIKSRASESIKILTNLFNSSKVSRPLGTENQAPFGQTTNVANTASSFQFVLPNNDRQSTPSAPLFGQTLPTTASTTTFGQPPPNVPAFGQPTPGASLFGQTLPSNPAFGQPASGVSVFSHPANSAWPAAQETAAVPLFTANSFQNQGIDGQQVAFGAGPFDSPDTRTMPVAASQFPPETGFFNKQSSAFGGNSVIANSSFITTENVDKLDSQNTASVIRNEPAVYITNSTKGFPPPRKGELSGTFSLLEDLTAEEREQFEAQHFNSGKIPLRPPPSELCFN